VTRVRRSGRRVENPRPCSRAGRRARMSRTRRTGSRRSRCLPAARSARRGRQHALHPVSRDQSVEGLPRA
jgi:hypothetical protein